MILTRTDSFLRDFRALPKNIQERAEKALRLLAANPRHPSLHVHKMEPRREGIWEVRVSTTYRITFSAAPNELILRRIGTHDILTTP